MIVLVVAIKDLCHGTDAQRAGPVEGTRMSEPLRRETRQKGNNIAGIDPLNRLPVGNALVRL